MALLQEKAHSIAQAALRSQAELRTQLLAKMKEREVCSKAKARRAKTNKKLESCPGISGPSASGKLMRKLPSYWQEEPSAKELRYKDVTGEDGLTAGLVGGHDATFSFSPRPDLSASSSFGKLNYLLEHLARHHVCC